MQNVVEIDIKSEGQTVSLALGEFLIEVERLKFLNQRVLIKVITGYGSHGKGGEIKKELSKLLYKLKKEEKISYFSSCEKLTKDELHSLCEKFPDLILDTEVSSYNSGVTLVVV